MVKKLLKSQRIVKSRKTSRALKVAKVILSEEPNFLTSNTRLAVALIETWEETHNGELLAIVKALKN